MCWRRGSHPARTGSSNVSTSRRIQLTPLLPSARSRAPNPAPVPGRWCRSAGETGRQATGDGDGCTRTRAAPWRAPYTGARPRVKLFVGGTRVQCSDATRDLHAQDGRQTHEDAPRRARGQNTPNDEPGARSSILRDLLPARGGAPMYICVLPECGAVSRAYALIAHLCADRPVFVQPCLHVAVVQLHT